MAIKIIYLPLLLNLVFFSNALLIAADQEEQEEVNIVTIPAGWQEAAQSWGMSIEAYKEEANRVLATDPAKHNYEDLVPLLNPYASIDTQVAQRIRDSLGSQEAYQAFLDAQAQSYPKFTFSK